MHLKKCHLKAFPWVVLVQRTLKQQQEQDETEPTLPNLKSSEPKEEGVSKEGSGGTLDDKEGAEEKEDDVGKRRGGGGSPLSAATVLSRDEATGIHVSSSVGLCICPVCRPVHSLCAAKATCLLYAFCYCPLAPIEAGFSFLPSNHPESQFSVSSCNTAPLFDHNAVQAPAHMCLDQLVWRRP